MIRMRLIDANAMIARLKNWDTKDKTDKALFNFTLNRINEQPTVNVQSEITEEDVREWCCKRCLTIIDNALYHKLWSRWSASEDVQAVVRCKDCKLSEHDIDITEHWCCYWDNKTLENGYCSYGERKDDEQNGSID